MESGDRYIYSHESGMGFGAAALGQPLTAEMTELDLKDGQEVIFLQNDDDSAWPIIEWTDAVGINRITTIDPALFESSFHPV
jgi:hypothetical protein